MNVALRDVTADDLPALFEHQLDPDATAMAAFPARDREAFMAHWARILVDETVVTKTVVAEGRVVGNIGSWEAEDTTLVGYWIGKEHWGRGFASAALAAFLGEVTKRPLHARVAKHNLASRRVLEKNGFTACGETTDGDIEEVLLVLRSG